MNACGFAFAPGLASQGIDARIESAFVRRSFVRNAACTVTERAESLQTIATESNGHFATSAPNLFVTVENPASANSSASRRTISLPGEKRTKSFTASP